MAKKSKINMGSYMPNEDEFKAYRWCVNNNIYKTNEDPNSYLKNDIWVKIYEYYKYYYNKYEK